jgi:hypothetical protein
MLSPEFQYNCSESLSVPREMTQTTSVNERYRYDVERTREAHTLTPSGLHPTEKMIWIESEKKS